MPQQGPSERPVIGDRAVQIDDVAAARGVADFDPGSFASVDANRRYRDSTGSVDFSTRIASSTPAPVLLPLFTEGLEALRGPGPVTLGDWLEETRKAALAGSLTHWLWDEPTYLRNRALRDGAVAEAGGAAFLNFVTEGDAAGISPHPLFCHHAYRSLNAHQPVGGKAAFRHFVDAGEAAGLRTSILFDPDFYLSQHPALRAMVANGTFGSALEHFVRVGMAAGYSFSPDFDREFYLHRYPDVLQAIADGSLPSAEWHFIFQGAREGRAPNPFFDPLYYVARYPLIGEEMRRLGIDTTIEHFLLLGRPRGLSANQPLAERSVAAEDGKALFEKRGRRAFGEIMDGAVTIPTAEAPRLSVIVPVSDQANFTAGFLKAAAFAIETLKSRRGFETEIIIVDNGSSDHTHALLTALPALRVARFEAPIGFPAAVNAGAAAARGDILLVVNNDIEFQPDAFDRVVSALDSNPTVGVVGAKVILPNETVQEVGAMLDRLGGSHGFGRGADPADVRGIRQVEVDYVSGCFIGFRRADFEAQAGFDEAFSPGYFEDVDFSLRMKRDLGKTTVVDTGLAITHYEHASFARGRPPAVNSALILRNRQRLKTRHAARFQTLKAGRAEQRAVRAREALTGTRVLVFEDNIPAGRLGSGLGRQEMILDAFTELGVPFDIVALSPSNRIDRYKDPRAKIFRAWMPESSPDIILRDHAAAYSHLWVCRTRNLADHIGAIARARAEFDLRVICDTEALESQQTVERMRIRGLDVDDETALALLAGALVDTLDVDLWVTVDKSDRNLLERTGVGPVVEIGHSARTGDGLADDGKFAERDRILFVGTVDDPDGATYDGLEWLLCEIWPRLAQMGEARLTVVGAWPDRLSAPFMERYGDRVDFMGEVDDASLSALYRQSRVAVAPARFAASPSGKVIESVMAGVPIVMTDQVAERLGLADNPLLACGRRDDGSQSFAYWLQRLYVDEVAWREQTAIQFAAVDSRFEKKDFVEAVRDALARPIRSGITS